MRHINYINANDLLTGIPELNLPPIEPLVIPELKMENGQGPVRVRAYFTNITAIGAGNYTLKKVRVNISSYRIDIHLSFPKIEIQGNYDINGNVLLFPIQSHGNFWALFGKRIIILRKNIVSVIPNYRAHFNFRQNVVHAILTKITEVWSYIAI